MLKKILFILNLIILLFVFILILDKKSYSLNNMNKIEIYDSNNTLVYEALNNHTSTTISINDINPLMIKALIQIEDKRFYNHHGFDIYSILSSIIKREKRGASTISEQYIKNLYYTNKKSYKRRIYELLYSIRLERLYNKNEILEAYLNNIYFGSNMYGICNACRYYFNKNPKEISLNNIAVLIALINSPTLYNPINNYTDAINKRNDILYKLYINKIISYEEYFNTKAAPIELNIKKINMYNTPILYYKDLVLKEYKELKIKTKFNKTIKIYTAYNSTLNDSIPLNNSCDIGIYALDNKGYILSSIGGNSYKEFNPTTMGKRDIGSTIKPLIYYLLLKNGYNEYKTIISSPLTINFKNNTYEIHNYNNIYPSTPINMIEALATSDNIYAYNAYKIVGYNALNTLFKAFNLKATNSIYLPLGNTPMSLKDITTIYNTIANKGVYYPNRTIKKIYSNNKLIYKYYPKNNNKLNSNICIKLANIMTNTFNPKIKRATGLVIAPSIKYPLAGKSGLTDYDSYMIGFNPKYTVGVWSGFIDNTPLTISEDKRLSKTIFLVAFNTLMDKEPYIWY